MIPTVNGREMTEEEIERSTVWRIMVVPKGSEFATMEFELANITLKGLREQFGLNETDPYFFDVYKIEPKQMAWVEKYSNQKLDLTKYKYFLDCYNKGDND